MLPLQQEDQQFPMPQVKCLKAPVVGFDSNQQPLLRAFALHSMAFSLKKHDVRAFGAVAADHGNLYEENGKRWERTTCDQFKVPCQAFKVRVD